MKWKVSAEQKQIAGYLCQKAVLQDTARQVEVWFTPQIPVGIGPGEFADLPGMILELSMNNGDRTVVADKVDLKTLDKKGLSILAFSFSSLGSLTLVLMLFIFLLILSKSVFL